MSTSGRPFRNTDGVPLIPAARASACDSRIRGSVAAVRERGAQGLGIAADLPRDRGELVQRVCAPGFEKSASCIGQNSFASRAHSAACAISSAPGWLSMGNGLKTSFTRPLRASTNASRTGRTSWQYGQVKSENSTIVTGASGLPSGGAELRDVELRPLVERGVVARDEPRELVLLRPGADEPGAERRHARRVAAGPVLPQALRERVRAAAASRTRSFAHSATICRCSGPSPSSGTPGQRGRVGGRRLGRDRPGPERRARAQARVSRVAARRRRSSCVPSRVERGMVHRNRRPLILAIAPWDPYEHGRPVERGHSRERGAIRKEPGGKLGVALVYPNVYRVGMANLGFHAVYRLLNADPRRALRAGLPAGGRRASRARVESGAPLRDFDVVAFSLSFEDDHANVLRVLAGAGLPLRAAARDERHPLVVGGGIAVQINPEPVAPFFDALLVGEGEVLVPPFLATRARGPRRPAPRAPSCCARSPRCAAATSPACTTSSTPTRARPAARG